MILTGSNNLKLCDVIEIQKNIAFKRHTETAWQVRSKNTEFPGTYAFFMTELGGKFRCAVMSATVNSTTVPTPRLVESFHFEGVWGFPFQLTSKLSCLQPIIWSVHDTFFHNLNALNAEWLEKTLFYQKRKVLTEHWRLLGDRRSATVLQRDKNHFSVVFCTFGFPRAQ